MPKRFSVPVGRLIAAILVSAMSASCSIVPPKRGDEGFTPAMPSYPSVHHRHNGAIFQAGHDMALFEDIKAKRVGDILTVLLVEQTDAKKSATTSTARDTEVSIPDPTVFGGAVTVGGRSILNNSLSSELAFDGSGDSAQSNKLDGNVTVSVVEVLPNKNLVVQGEKWISINQGEEFIRLQGIVRPVDIRPDNTVLSTQVGNTLITYGGTGSLANSNRKGWLAEFFTTVVWPF
jgi:flagellar L-ring protein precursor FlgH